MTSNELLTNKMGTLTWVGAPFFLQQRIMAYLLDRYDVGFPDPRLSEPDGFLAKGGGLEPEWLLNAYFMGIFPWYDDETGAPYWYSLDPRMVLMTEDFRPSKSLRRTLQSGRFEVRVDTCFREVMELCASVERPGQSLGSWISQNFMEAYCRLHELGFAHSFETFEDGRLVGGLYGVSLCDWFSGESMFHLVRDASKVAFARMVEFAQLHGFRFIDAQQPTPHLASLGAKPTPRELFLKMMEENDLQKTYRGRWRNNTVVLLIGGNEGDRMSLLVRAMIEIGKRIGMVSLLSSVYETEPWGFDASQNFLNQAIVVDTDLSAEEVLTQALEIEKELGRQRNGEGYASRPMDIDLIFFNSEVMYSERLTIPHPRMDKRRFVLEPLAEIIPNFLHPKLKKTVRELLEECADTGAVKRFF